MNDIDAEIDRMITVARASMEEFLQSLPASLQCQRHPGSSRRRDDQKSLSERRGVFVPCEICAEARRQQIEIDRLRAFGVPLNLCHAQFDNWTPDDEQAEANLASVREFVNRRRGFLVLLGDLGTGKTHLSVSALRTFKDGLFVKQSELLRRLRHTYRDRAAIDPVDSAQDAGCLVLDEVGLSPGGRDELPMLHDILDHRHGNQKPTILTGNLTFDELRVVIGPRMADRLQESASAVLNFGGQSHRSDARPRYFDDKYEAR